MGTISFWTHRQERGLPNLCLNLFSRVQTPWLLQPVIKLAAPWGSCLHPQTEPGPPALRSTLAPRWEWMGRTGEPLHPPRPPPRRVGRARSTSELEGGSGTLKISRFHVQKLSAEKERVCPRASWWRAGGSTQGALVIARISLHFLPWPLGSSQCNSGQGRSWCLGRARGKSWGQFERPLN